MHTLVIPQRTFTVSTIRSLRKLCKGNVKKHRNYMFNTISDLHQAGRRKSFFDMLNHCIQITAVWGHCVRTVYILLIILSKNRHLKWLVLSFHNRWWLYFTKHGCTPLSRSSCYLLELPSFLGPDCIPPILLKLISTEISTCLRLLFTASLSQSKILSNWKRTLVCPLALFTKNDKAPSNYIDYLCH